MPNATFLTVCLALGASGAAAPLWAQIPGESVYGRRVNFRDEFRAHAYGEVKVVLDEWIEAFQSRDPKRVGRFMMDPAVFAPIGWRSEGKAAVNDSLASWIPRVTGYYLIPADFDAGGSMAYLSGTARYELRGPGGAGGQTVNTEVVMVLYQMGKSWKVRGYFERPAPAGP